jgi:hypothetical protein
MVFLRFFACGGVLAAVDGGGSIQLITDDFNSIAFLIA